MKFIDYDKHRKDSGIYCITCTGNGKKYIGKTEQTFSKRYWHHKWKLNNGCHDNEYLQNSWNKYGKDSFVFEVVYVLKPNDDINDLEKYYIELYNTFESGFNMTKGGEGLCGYEIPDDIRKYIGEINRQRMTGTKLSESTKQKMRESSRHLSPSQSTIDKVRQYMKNRTVSDVTKEKLRIANTGSNSPVTHLNESDVRIIKTELIRGTKQSVLAENYNVSMGVISAIANNRTWKHVMVDGWEDYIGSKKPRHYLSKNEILEIKQKLSNNVSCSQIAREYNTQSSTISNIKNGLYYK